MEVVTVFLLFCHYGFLGWLIEVVTSFLLRHRFVNKGLLRGPLSPLFGLAALTIVFILGPFRDNLLVLSILSLVVATSLEYGAHWFFEKVFSLRLWDYSHERFTIHGRIELVTSVLSGLLALVMVLFLDPLFRSWIKVLPEPLAWVLSVMAALGLLIDWALRTGGLLAFRRGLVWLRDRADSSTEVPIEVGRRASRLFQSFPDLASFRHSESLEHLRARLGLKKVAPRDVAVDAGFASGLSFTKLFWVFLIAAWVGVVVEVVYGLVTLGRVENRSGLVWGMTNPVYGLGALVMTLALARNQKRRDLSIFFGSMVIGGTFEYLCSLGQEWAFGSVSWEYSGTLLNLHGRTNLSFALAWGFLGLVWVRYLYPTLSTWIERIPRRWGRPLTVLLLVLVTVDVSVSAAAVWRWSHRVRGDAATTSAERLLDQVFDDKTLGEVYPNMRFVPK